MATACYTDPYLTGSFRAIPFTVESADSTHGRRGAEGEFPFGENTAYADLGRKIRTYSISARFQTNNHVLEAAALIAACELKGPGVLVHPTRGVILSAACRSLKVTDKPEEAGGITTVDMEFVEANNWPNGLSLVGQLLGLALGSIIGTSRASFKSNYTPNTVQTFRKDAVLDAAQGQVAFIAQEYASATTSAATEDNRNRIYNDLTRLSVTDDMASDVDTVDKGLALGMNAIAVQLVGVAKFRAFQRIANNAARTSTFASKAGIAENAIYSNVRVIAAAYMAEGALEADATRTGQVFEQLDKVRAILDDEVAYARANCFNQLQIDLAEFRDETVAQLYTKAYDSPGLASYSFGGRVHPVVAAYSIYGDAKKHRDLEIINPVGISGRIGPDVVGTRP